MLSILSLGVSQKITENPYYNLGAALPFLCAFYLMNKDQGIVIPWLDYELAREFSSILRIMMLAFFYYMIAVYFAIASHFSLVLQESKLYWALPILICFGGFKLLFSAADEPQLGLIFSVHAALIMLFHWLGDGKKEFVSLLVTQILGAVLSVTCFTLGVLWYLGDYLFMDQITSVLRIGQPTDQSLKLGAIMLFTFGYVVFYGIFQVSRMLKLDAE
jgi:hypothetical protein